MQTTRVNLFDLPCRPTNQHTEAQPHLAHSAVLAYTQLVMTHRDLKLENILLLKAGGANGSGRKLPVAKLTDFGLHVVSLKECCPLQGAQALPEPSC